MSWNIRYLDEVDGDFKKLDGSQKIKVRKAIKRTLTNPLPRSQGGYGIELGHKGGINLANCLEIKLRGEGLRVIYKLIRTDTEMLVIIVGLREEEVYNDAQARITQHSL